MAAEYTKPLPTLTEETKPYWEACKRHELRVQKCLDCSFLRFPPSVICPECMGMNLEWVRVSGKGKVYTWNVFHQLYHPGFADDIPYNVAVIELEEGPRLISNIVGCKNEEIYINMPVEVVFEDVTEEITLPKFKPVAQIKR